MDDYKKKAELIKRYGNTLKRRKIMFVRRCALSVSGICAAAIIGLGIWNSSAIKGALTPDPEHGYADIIDTQPTTETTASPVTTTTSATTQRTTSTRLTETVTTTTQTTELSSQTWTQSTAAPVTTAALITSNEPVTTAASTDTTQTTTQTTVSQSVQTTDTETTLTTEVTTKNTNTAIGTPYCFCSMTDSDGKRYYSYEEPADTNFIGDLIGTASVDLIYQNGYKGYEIKELTVNAEIYEYSEKAVAVRYEECEEFYIYHAR